MVRHRRRAVFTAAVAATVCFGLGGARSAAAAEPTAQELMEQIKALQAKVQQLETTQDAQKNLEDARYVDGTVAKVQADADRRSQLLQATGFTAGINKGKITIQSEDGNFVFNPSFQLQFRYVNNYRDENANGPVAGRAEDSDGLEIRRMKFIFEGNAFNPDLKYKFQWATSRSSGNPVLEEAYFTYKFADALAVKGGQFKDVTFHEEILSSKRQLAVDRSLVNVTLGGQQTKFIQGVGLIWDDGEAGLPLRAEVGYSDGANTSNTNFQDGGGSTFLGVANPDWGAYGRVEYLAMGNWKQYDDFTAMGNTENLLVLGGGAFFTQAGDAYALQHTADAQFETGPIGVYVAYLGVARDSGAGGAGSQYDWGGLGQIGYMLNEKVEVFGRYSYIDLDSGVASANGESRFHEITAGFNYYFRGHAAKFTADVNWYPSGVPVNETGIDVLAPTAGDDEIVFRAQFQLLI